MRQIIILLSATTLALTPFVSNAKKPVNVSEYEVEVLTCSCAAELLADDEVLYTCDVSWTDAIAGAANPATYGASIDVEWEQEGVPTESSRSVDLEYDWTEACDLTTCTVEDKQFILTNYSDQIVTLTAAVKAFENKSGGKTPRNFEKSILDCSVDTIDPI